MVVLGVTVDTADASSIVYQTNGNLYLTSPDASMGYQLTTGGGWSDPSQADSGMVAATRDGLLYRLDRSGRPAQILAGEQAGLAQLRTESRSHVSLRRMGVAK